jgi:probable FeS assembly SUF system protein SufT
VSKNLILCLERDCSAVQVPVGNTVSLAAGTEVEITQSLGSSFTVQAKGDLYSIQGKDADALGLDWTGGEEETGEVPSTVEAVDKRVWWALKRCFDPEIPVNIVDLGLVYGVNVVMTGDSTYTVSVKMTLTTPGCGMAQMIADDAQQRVRAVPGVEEVSVDLVWDPPWQQSLITPAGRLTLGLD